MHTAPSCALRASSAKSAKATRLSREYSVCICMSSLMRSMPHERAAVRVPFAETSGRDAVHVVACAECEDVDDLPYLIGPGAIFRRIAHQQSRPRRRARIQRGALDVPCFPGASQRRSEPLVRFFSETAAEVAQPRFDPTGFDHRAKQCLVGSRENPRDLRREVVRRERIERADPELMFFV